MRPNPAYPIFTHAAIMSPARRAWLGEKKFSPIVQQMRNAYVIVGGVFVIRACAGPKRQRVGA